MALLEMKKFLNGRNVFYGVLVIATALHITFLAYNYISCDEVETFGAERQTRFQLPALTLCSNVPVRQIEEVEPEESESERGVNLVTYLSDTYGYEELFEEDIHLHIPPGIQDETLFMGGPNITKKNELEILSRLASMNKSQRLQYSEFPTYRIDLMFLTTTENYEIDCEELPYHVFNNIYYGNCITINPDQFKTSNIRKREDAQGISMTNTLPHHRNGQYKQKDMPFKYQVMVIHEPYTQPVFDPRNIIKIPMSSDIHITLTKDDYVHETNCVSRDTFTAPQTTLGQVYTEQEYLYSLEACVASCVQRLTIKHCNCQLAHIDGDSCLPVCRGCSKIPEKDMEAVCGCKVPCSYSKYHLDVANQMSVSDIADQENLFVAQNMLLLKHKEEGTPTEALISEFRKLKRDTKVTIRIGSHVTGIIKLQPICQYEIMLSQVGGILGSYIGLSIMMIIEIAYDYTLSLIRRINKIKKSSSTSKQKENDNSKMMTSKVTSSISLVARIGDSNMLLKLFWTIVLLGGLSKTFLQGHELLKDYLEYPVLQRVEEHDGVEFPSVTVCSNNILSKDSQSPAKDMVMEMFNDTLDYAQEIISDHLPHPHPSNCVSQQSPFHQWMNLFHNHNTQYLYTYQECEVSCVFNQSLEKLHLSQPRMAHQGRTVFTEAQLDDVQFTDGFSPSDLSACECRIPCREVNYIVGDVRQWKIQKSEVFTNDGGDESGDGDIYDNLFDHTEYTGSLASSWLTLRPHKQTTKVIKEEAATQLVTLLCEVGGTMGLWVGISLLSLIELNCLLLKKLLAHFKNNPNI